MHTRTRFIPIMEAKVGMTLATAISLTQHGHLSIKLAKGTHLSPLCIDQLIAHGSEYIEISEPDTRTREQATLSALAATQRLHEIFSGANMRDPTTLALFRQVMIYRSAT